MEVLHLLGGPLVGALIGYITNYIAVKMLFRPLKPIQIGRITLPFTPGVIPKRKPALAKALGKAVGTTLLTKEDLKNVLLSQDVRESVTNIFVVQLQQVLKSEKTVKEQIVSAMEEEHYLELREQVSDKMADKVMERLGEIGLGEIVVEKAKSVAKEKFSNSFVAMFLKEDMIDSLAQPIGEYVEHYICTEGRDYIEPIVEKELMALEESQISEITSNIPFHFEKIKKEMEELYVKGIGNFADSIVEHFKVEEIVEEKVNRMPVEELETLVLSVMKHELQMVVNLGAFIGFLLGMFNLLF